MTLANENFWKKYDASGPDTAFQNTIDGLATQYIVGCGIPRDAADAVYRATTAHLEHYANGTRPELDKVIAINLFTPSEFEHIDANNEALALLLDWLMQSTFRWSSGSDSLSRLIRTNFRGGRSLEVKSDRAPLNLDALVEIAGRWTAIEVEASNNKDNGITSMRFAIRRKQADFGVLIVPWTAIGRGRASERDSLGRIDDEFDGHTNINDGPIYRLAIVKKLDVCRLLHLESCPERTSTPAAY